MTFKPSLKTERERAQMEIDDAIEAISVLDNAIACGFLKDKHSLIAQEWIKEYKTDIERCKMSKENMLRAMVATKQLEIDKLKRKIKEMEDKFEQQRIDEGGWNSDNTRQRDTKNRKKDKRIKSSDSSDK